MAMSAGRGAEMNVTPLIDVLLTVRADGMAALNQEVLDLGTLRTRIEELYRRAATRLIFIRGEKSIEFGRVADVIALARDAGVSQVALMTD
jgi:biopolymer transport protein ExbD